MSIKSMTRKVQQKMLPIQRIVGAFMVAGSGLGIVIGLYQIFGPNSSPATATDTVVITAGFGIALLAGIWAMKMKAP